MSYRPFGRLKLKTLSANPRWKSKADFEQSLDHLAQTIYGSKGAALMHIAEAMLTPKSYRKWLMDRKKKGSIISQRSRRTRTSLTKRRMPLR